MKIIHKLFLGFFLIALVILIGAYFLLTSSRKAIEKSIATNSIQLATEIMNEIDRGIYCRIGTFREYSRDLILMESVLESNHEFQKLDDIQEYINKKDKEWTSIPKQELTPFMQELINKKLSQELREKITFYKELYGYRIFGEVFVTNKYGANVAQTGKTSDYRQNDEEWWQRAKSNGIYIEDVQYDTSADVYSTDIAIRIDDKNANFVGVIKAVLNIKEATNTIKQLDPAKTHVGYTTMQVQLLTEDQRVIYSTDDFKMFEDASHLLEPFLQQKEKHINYVIREGDDPGEGEELSIHVCSKGYKDFKGLGWILLIDFQTEEVLAPVTKLRNTILIISLTVTIFAILIGFFLSRSISQPIVALREYTNKIGKGKLDVQIDVESTGEIGQLATSFKEMAGNLQKTTVSREYLDNIITTMIGGLLVLTPDGTIHTVNQGALDLLGYTEDELLDQQVGIIFAEEEKIVDDLLQDGSISDVEKTCLAKDGRTIPVLFLGSIMRTDDGKIQGMVCVLLDITKQKRLEDQLRKRADEVEQINKLMVGRELKIEELRKEINKLKLKVHELEKT